VNFEFDIQYKHEADEFTAQAKKMVNSYKHRKMHTSNNWKESLKPKLQNLRTPCKTVRVGKRQYCIAKVNNSKKNENMSNNSTKIRKRPENSISIGCIKI